MGTCCLADSSSTISMNYFILAPAAIACDECQTAASDLVDRLLSEESIAEQIAILKLVVCPQLPADIDCEGLLDAEFLAMATCIYNEFILNQDVCGRLGLCYKENKLTQVRDWTCDECKDILARTAEFMGQEDTITEAIAYLQGDCYCGQDGHTAECPDLVATVLPLALPVLGNALNEQST